MEIKIYKEYTYTLKNVTVQEQIAQELNAAEIH